MRNFYGDDQSGGYRGDKRSSGRRDFGGRGSDRPTMHEATCTNCGETCEVPFRPNGSKPVFCRDCFKNVDSEGSNNRPERRNYDRPSYDKPSYEKPFKPANSNNDQYKDQFERLNVKMDYILKALSLLGATKVPSEPTASSKIIDVPAKSAKAPLASTETPKVKKVKKAKKAKV